MKLETYWGGVRGGGGLIDPAVLVLHFSCISSIESLPAGLPAVSSTVLSAVALAKVEGIA